MVVQRRPMVGDRPDGRRGGDPHARFVYLATGYYAYEAGHVVDFPGQADFAGEVVHPQHWPEGMPLAGRRVVVVGSGATAVTLLPALVEEGAANVTMLQRSPSYVVALPERDVVAAVLHWLLPTPVAHRLVRGKNVVLSTAGYQVLRRFPTAGRWILRRQALDRLPEGYAVDTHFSPRYDPWDQRLCVAPDGDLFDVLSDGRAQVVTDTIERFERDGIRLRSGALLAGGPRRHRDRPADPGGRRGGGRARRRAARRLERARLQGAHALRRPEPRAALGYTNASWTLRADLSARWFCSLLRHLDRHGHTVATPRYDEQPVKGEEFRPLLDLTSGYIRRGAHLMPRQGRRRPWRVVQSYLYDLAVMRLGRIDDGRLELR